jgi:hypothetical protein
VGALTPASHRHGAISPSEDTTFLMDVKYMSAVLPGGCPVDENPTFWGRSKYFIAARHLPPTKETCPPVRTFSISGIAAERVSDEA